MAHIFEINNKKDADSLKYKLMQPIIESFEHQAKNQIELHDYILTGIRAVIQDLEKPIDLPEKYDEQKVSDALEKTAHAIDMIISILKDMSPMGKTLKETHDKIKSLQKEIIISISKQEHDKAEKLQDEELELYDVFMKLSKKADENNLKTWITGEKRNCEEK